MKTPDPTLSALRLLRVRDESVLLDSDLATLYGVETKAFNKAIKRNARRFPSDFAFQLTAEEFAALRFQIGTSNGRGGRRYAPWVFTEHGARRSSLRKRVARRGQSPTSRCSVQADRIRKQKTRE